MGELTDVYAAGLVLYHALAGRSPFAATSASLLLVAQVTVDPEPLHRLRPDLPETLILAVHRALSKEASERPTASEFAATLHALADTVQAAPLPELVSQLQAPKPLAAIPRIYISAIATREAPMAAKAISDAIGNKS